VPKICQKYRKISKYIQNYQKPNELKNHLSTEITPYIFRFPLFLCFLHTVEVTGSNPVSPTTFFSTTCVIPLPGKMAGVPKLR
jgi:hypothetical protein